jgi:hypothetical protein
MPHFCGMARPKNHPAFPFPGGVNPPVRSNSGMSMRDWFAGSALQGYRASDKYSQADSRLVADLSFQDADAMLEKRENQIHE